MYLVLVVSTLVINRAVSLKLDNQVLDYRRMQRILDDIESILQTVYLYNRTLRPLLRNIIFFFRTGLCALFTVLSLDLYPFMRSLILIPVYYVSLNLIITGLYVAREKSLLNFLYWSF